MRRQFVLLMALLIIALAVPSNAQNADVSVDEGAPLTVECVLRVEERAEWKLDGDAPPADLRPAGEAAAAGRLTARLHAAAARAAHAGVYTCARPPGQRVRVHVRAAGPSARAVPGEAAAPAPGAEPKLKQELYVVGTFHAFNCSVPRAADAGSYVWRKNGTLVEDLPELRGRYKLDNAEFKFTARTHEDDFGNYSCAIGGAAPALVVQLHGRPQAKLPANSHVVEGQNLRLVCKVVGKPYPAVKWLVRNASDEGANLTDVTAALGERVELKDSEQGVPGAELLLTAAQRADAGVYTCQPGSGGAAETVLRVKDMYAALWPFLGICAEVFVLCAIILVYEKRRTKPELDDSDTDNHEQKKS